MKDKIRTLIHTLLDPETLRYIVVGVLTTLVDYLIFVFFNVLFKRAGMPVERSASLATALAWFFAVIFAYLANKLAVFRSMDWSRERVARELAAFFGARAGSGLLVLAAMWLWVSVLGMNEYIGKLVTGVFNVVINYAISKFYIFRK